MGNSVGSSEEFDESGDHPDHSPVTSPTHDSTLSLVPPQSPPPPVSVSFLTLKHIRKSTILYSHQQLVGKSNQMRFIYFDAGFLILENPAQDLSLSPPILFSRNREIVLKLHLEKIMNIDLEMINGRPNILIRDENHLLIIEFHHMKYATRWMSLLNEEIALQKIQRGVVCGRGIERLQEMIGALSAEGMTTTFTHPEAEESPHPPLPPLPRKQIIPPPLMKIVILVVGTRGDVQPFINLGLELRAQGHDVRIATHAEYRQDVLQEQQLRYYPLAGDPRKLSEFMVKTAGRLIPDLTNEEERKELPEKMQMLRDICFSTWPACTCPDPEDPDQVPFVADAIISNPVSYGHIHCAEALGIPLVSPLFLVPPDPLPTPSTSCSPSLGIQRKPFLTRCPTWGLSLTGASRIP
jgi:hypothetical protein